MIKDLWFWEFKDTNMVVIERKFCGGHLDSFFEIIDISLRLHIFYTPIHVLF